MAERIIIGLEYGADAAAVRHALLHQLSAHAAPVDSLPDVIVAEVEEHAADTFVEYARAIPGVRYVERDAPRFTS